MKLRKLQVATAFREDILKQINSSFRWALGQCPPVSNGGVGRVLCCDASLLRARERAQPFKRTCALPEIGSTTWEAPLDICTCCRFEISMLHEFATVPSKTMCESNESIAAAGCHRDRFGAIFAAMAEGARTASATHRPLRPLTLTATV